MLLKGQLSLRNRVLRKEATNFLSNNRSRQRPDSSHHPRNLILWELLIQLFPTVANYLPGQVAMVPVRHSRPQKVGSVLSAYFRCKQLQCLFKEMNLLKFKIELLVDMVTLANLDCDKLEAKGG